MDFRIVKGKIPVLISAAHAKKHLRLCYSKRRLKPNEVNTAKIVEIIAKKTKCWGIFPIKNLFKDPNWYKKSSYKIGLGKLVKDQKIQLVIDIHGSKKGSAYLIVYSSLLNNNLNKIFFKVSQKYFPKKYISEGSFKDYIQETITEYCFRELKIPAIQVELNWKLRLRRSNHFKPLINFLNEFICEANKN